MLVIVPSSLLTFSFGAPMMIACDTTLFCLNFFMRNK